MYPEDAVEDVHNGSATPSPYMINYYHYHYLSFDTDKTNDTGE
jgi:hypothetical protein